MFAREMRPQREPELRPSEGRVPPHDLDAEAAVLSATLLSPDAVNRVLEFLEPQHFYSVANRRVYEAVMELRNAGKPVDVVEVASLLRTSERLQQVGGTQYLARLTDATPAVAHVEAHAQLVREKWRVREVIRKCQESAAEGYGNYGDAQEFIDRTEQSIFDIARLPETSSVVRLHDAIKGTFELISAAKASGRGITGLPSGFADLDRICSGLHKGDLYIVAARPGMGKTAFVLNVALNVAAPPPPPEEPGGPEAELGQGVAFFSLEMPREQVAARLLAMEARVDMGKIRSGQVHGQDWSRLTDAATRVGRLPIWIDDTPALGILELRAKLRRLKAEIGHDPVSAGAKELGLVVVDYLQLMQGSPYAQSREQEISELSRGLKRISKEMSIPVIALSQLNRAVETRTAKDKRPQLSDLRESGAIEQDADCICFIYRDEYYTREASEVPGIAEIIVAKQRNGPTDTTKLRYTSAYTRFDNLARDDYEFDGMDNYDGSEA